MSVRTSRRRPQADFKLAEMNELNIKTQEIVKKRQYSRQVETTLVWTTVVLRSKKNLVAMFSSDFKGTSDV